MPTLLPAWPCPAKFPSAPTLPGAPAPLTHLYTQSQTRAKLTPVGEMEPTITGAMLQRAKGPELVSHLKARASATNLSPLLTSEAPKPRAAYPPTAQRLGLGLG